MIDDLTQQFTVFVGVIGTTLAGFVGLITRHTSEESGVDWRKVWRELPFAVFSGILAAGIGAYFNLPQLLVIALACAMTHLSPAVTIALIKAWIQRKGSGNGA